MQLEYVVLSQDDVYFCIVLLEAREHTSVSHQVEGKSSSEMYFLEGDGFTLDDEADGLHYQDGRVSSVVRVWKVGIHFLSILIRIILSPPSHLLLSLFPVYINPPSLSPSNSTIVEIFRATF